MSHSNSGPQRYSLGGRPIVAASLAGLAMGATAIIPLAGAEALGDECGPGANEIAEGLCEISFTQTPDSPWSPPAGTQTLHALIVGAGGAGSDFAAYAGGGGEVLLVELAPEGDVTITVGASPTGDSTEANDSVLEQGATQVRAAAGERGGESFSGGASGNGNPGSFAQGGGAGGPADYENPGPGIVASDLQLESGAESLFGDDERCFGGGGFGAYYELLDRPEGPDCGGGWADPAGILPSEEPLLGSGGGGAVVENPGWITGTTAVEVRQPGASGSVILRYVVATDNAEPPPSPNPSPSVIPSPSPTTPPSPAPSTVSDSSSGQLVATGADTGIAMPVGLGVIAVGVALVLLQRRQHIRTRSQRRAE